MYKLILVEDEPGAAENIRDIIQFYCPRFELIGTAEHGGQGLELARRLRPDLLLTDIRMPRMDGLELLKRIHAEFPDLTVIIVSGYPDFEYTRAAMQHGAADYILKPVTPSALGAALERIIPLLDEQIGRNRLSIIRRLLNNSAVAPGEMEKYFTAPAYTIGISRKNGLPSRFSGGVYSLKYSAGEEAIDLYGRDEMESIHICSDNSVRCREAFERINWLHGEIPGYATTVLCRDPFPIEKLPETIKSLYNILDSSLTIGLNQVISAAAPGAGGLSRSARKTPNLANRPGSEGSREPGNRDFYGAKRRGNPQTREAPGKAGKTGGTGGETFRVLDHYIRESKIDRIRGFFLDFLESCRKEKRPQLSVEKSIRLLLERTRFLMNSAAPDDEFEFMLDDAFFYATNYDELKESFSDILDRLLQDRSGNISKIDTPEFFELIKEYVSLHLAEPLTLQSMCGHFGISQTYLSRLFRKYSGQSFINYLTGLRIEKAKGYLANRDMLIKDIAPMVGFSDQFYFSRVFRSLTGRSPSKYQER
ncbi:MAG: response regulator [Treponema sp.]|jgi:two-component system response regulator YesN|nr:response regulator [Treponema sp.]